MLPIFQLIFSGEYTKAMDENYHKDHLACHNCDKKLVACRYIVKDENPHCIPCYQELYAHNCEECKKPIGPDYKVGDLLRLVEIKGCWKRLKLQYIRKQISQCLQCCDVLWMFKMILRQILFLEVVGWMGCLWLNM